MNDPLLQELANKLECEAIEFFFTPPSKFKTELLNVSGLTFVGHEFDLSTPGKKSSKVYFRYVEFGEALISLKCSIIVEISGAIKLLQWSPDSLTFEEHEEPKVILTLEGLSKKVIELEKQVKYQREEINYLKEKLYQN